MLLHGVRVNTFVLTALILWETVRGFFTIEEWVEGKAKSGQHPARQRAALIEFRDTFFGWYEKAPSLFHTSRFFKNPAHCHTGTSMPIEIHPIGHVRSPYRKQGDAPRQGRLSETVSEIVIRPEYRAGLLDLEKKNHLFVLCWFDKADRKTLRTIPPQDTREHGVFATRSPDRPNPVAICLVDLLGIEAGVLRVRGLDAFDGTPVIDIKPYFPDIDSPEELSGKHGNVPIK